MMPKAIQNFHIPVENFDRAKRFYAHIFDTELQEMEFQQIRLAVFEFSEEGLRTGGALIAGSDRKPSREGITIYFDCSPDLKAVLGRVPSEGGQIIIEKTELGPGMGYYAIFDDTEGNRIGLYSEQ